MVEHVDAGGLKIPHAVAPFFNMTGSLWRGWGGHVNVLELAHMLDATELNCALERRTLFELAHVFDATELHGARKMRSLLELAL